MGNICFFFLCVLSFQANGVANDNSVSEKLNGDHKTIEVRICCIARLMIYLLISDLRCTVAWGFFVINENWRRVFLSKAITWLKKIYWRYFLSICCQLHTIRAPILTKKHTLIHINSLDIRKHFQCHKWSLFLKRLQNIWINRNIFLLILSVLGNRHLTRKTRKIGCSQSTTINGGSSCRISCKQPCRRRWINEPILGVCCKNRRKRKSSNRNKK